MSLNISKLKIVKAKPSESVNFLSRLLATEISFGQNRINDKVKQEFYLELNSLLTAGVDVKTALELISSENSKTKFGSCLIKLNENIIQGDSLSKAMENSAEFTPYEYFSIQIGEETGKVQVIIADLARYFGMRLKQRRQITSALSYPILILSVSIGAVAFMMFYMIPMFSDVFKRFGGELPKITKMVISFSEGIKNHFWVGIILFSILLLVFQSLKTNQRFNQLKSKFIIRTPFFGEIYSFFFLSKFCNSMALLISSKVPLLRCIELVDQMTNYYPLRASIPLIKQSLIYGKTLHESLRETKIFNYG
jgi:type IV pilus assembly protein PilC